jgi:hypothetical protein
MDNVEPALRDMISKVSGNRNLGVQTRLFHDLGISGDDAAELLNDVHQKFGTSFAEFPFVDFFPTRPRRSWLTSPDVLDSEVGGKA